MELYAIKRFYDAREGLVELDDDVLSIVRQTRELFGSRVKITLEPTTGHYVFIENCDDGTERLIFTTEELDPRALERLIRSDGRTRNAEDLYDAAEREQDELHAQRDAEASERIMETGEPLAHALRKDGVMPRMPLPVSIPKDISAGS